jgi:hypothetical protein
MPKPKIISLQKTILALFLGLDETSNLAIPVLNLQLFIQRKLRQYETKRKIFSIKYGIRKNTNNNSDDCTLKNFLR